jgi:hypothetical protein
MLVRRGKNSVYFYRTFREGGRVVTRYVASGAAAVEVARRFEAENQARRAALERWARERRRLDELDGLVAAWYALVEVALREAMAAADCYEHSNILKSKNMTMKERDACGQRALEVSAVIEAGDPKYADVVRRAFDLSPDELIALYEGDPAARVVKVITDRLAGTNLYRREAVARMFERTLSDLAGPEPTGLERALAERAAVCWLAVYEADLACQRAETTTTGGVVEYFERRRDRAQKRFESVCKSLAVTRKLAAPVYRPRVDFGGRLAEVVAGRN